MRRWGLAVVLVLPGCAVVDTLQQMVIRRPPTVQSRPMVTVDAECDSAHVVISGFPDDVRYWIGLAGDPPYGGFGNRDQIYPVDATAPYGYTVKVFDDAAGSTMAETIGLGPVDC